MQRPRFIAGGFYHIYNRGVERRRTFLDDKDRLRFIHDLFEFNDRRPAPHMHFHYGGSTSVVEKERRGARTPLVSLLAYALMPNHYHLLVRARESAAVPAFMRKLGTGYTMYFNERYARSGVLFQGRYQVRVVMEDRYLRHLVSYIHLNPIALVASGWKEGEEIRDPEKALRNLKTYRWSSLQDFLGEKNFSSVLNLELVRDLGIPLGTAQMHGLREWLIEPVSYLDKIRDATLDYGG